jgi:hypothetical protein
MNAIVKSSAHAAVQPVLTPNTFDQLVTFAELAAKSGMVPRDYINKPGAIMVSVQMGSELGLSPMQSVNSIAVINGRPGVFGDALIGLCRQSPLCQDIVETIDGDGDNRTAVCVAIRLGSTPCTSRFSVADAKRAGLWGKSGPWTQYPDRMLQNRARGFSLRDAFPDLLRGLKTVEELRDTPPDTFRGTTIESASEHASTAPQAATHSHHHDSAINDEIPDRVMNASSSKPKRTVGDFLADIAAKLSACTSIEEVTAIASSAPVQAALAALKNGALQELNALLAEAMQRTDGAAKDPAEDQQVGEIPPADESLNTAALVATAGPIEEVIPPDTQPVINPQEASAQKALDGILRELAEAVALSERQKSPGPIIDMLTNPLKQNRIGRFKQAYKSKYREVLLACAKSPILDVMREIQAAYPEFCDDVIDVTQSA